MKKKKKIKLIKKFIHFQFQIKAAVSQIPAILIRMFLIEFLIY